MGKETGERPAMRIVRTPSNKVEGPISDYHVLTYADSRVGPLPHYIRRRVPRDQVEAIVSRINQRDEAATFFPLPLSAVPRKVIWDQRHWAELRAHLVNCLLRPGEIVLFADTAVWATRLRLAGCEAAAGGGFAELPGVGSGARITVRVTPPRGR